jgi:hypothetical protein
MICVVITIAALMLLGWVFIRGYHWVADER